MYWAVFAERRSGGEQNKVALMSLAFYDNNKFYFKGYN